MASADYPFSGTEQASLLGNGLFLRMSYRINSRLRSNDRGGKDGGKKREGRGQGGRRGRRERETGGVLNH